MSNYDWSFDYIPKVNIAFEIGSRDLLDANTIQKKYGCKVISFECNPDCIEECKKNKSIFNNDNIILIEKAVSRVDGYIKFLSIDLDKYDNMGASSIFELDFITSRNTSDPDYHKSNVQKLVKAPSIRFDTFCKENNIIPDAIFMDVQEAELEVLSSASDYLKNVKYIVTEVSRKSTYKGGCNIVSLNNFLENKGFQILSHTPDIISETEYFSYLDCVYINKSI